MAFAFLRVDAGDDRLEDDEIALGEPDHEAETSLPVHVEKCARRYRVTIRRLNIQGRNINRLLFMVGGLLLWQVMTSPQFAAAVSFVAKFGGTP